MLDPSNPIPSSKTSAENSFADTVKCCHNPGMSTKRRSTTRIPSSLIFAITSFAVIQLPLVLRILPTLRETLRRSVHGPFATRRPAHPSE